MVTSAMGSEQTIIFESVVLVPLMISSQLLNVSTTILIMG